MNSQELYLKVFEPVAERVIQRKDSLEYMQRFKMTGIEGWLKVETVAALGKLVNKLQNRGPDIVLEDGTPLELKAATDLNNKYLLRGVSECDTCLFLGNGRDKEKIAQLESDGIKLVAKRFFSIGESEWVVGLLHRMP